MAAEYPVLSKMACAHLGGPSSESYCERVFSWCKTVRSQSRASMGEDVFEALVMAKMNMSKLNLIRFLGEFVCKKYFEV